MIRLFFSARLKAGRSDRVTKAHARSLERAWASTFWREAAKERGLALPFATALATGHREPTSMTKKTSTEQNGSTDTSAHSGAYVMRRILQCLTAVQKGTFSVRLPSDWTGLEGKVADSLNEIIASNERMAKELRRVSRMVGKQGK